MQAHGDPVRVQCLYERTLARFPVTHHLWLCYGRYLELHLKLPDLIDRVYARSLRNCPWVGALWSRWGSCSCDHPCIASVQYCVTPLR